uniref:Structure-specific endonuclease subunit SLX1 homolog n=1 Tax=Panagrellus redivivus TaxID=6233 RepID=A0A7E4VML1_PANRE
MAYDNENYDFDFGDMDFLDMSYRPTTSDEPVIAPPPVSMKSPAAATSVAQFSFGYRSPEVVTLDFDDEPGPSTRVTPPRKVKSPVKTTKATKLAIPENVPFSELASTAFGGSPTKAASASSTSVEYEFFGVYCLISRSPVPNYKNRCYIGYTVDPNRRIRQHNAGKHAGGAKKTSDRGPWDMVCIVHGFPNSVAALGFEWAWQNPAKSRRLKLLNLKKKPKESQFAFRLRIVCHMLNTDPWKRLSLTFRWLIPSEEIPFPTEIPPPKHVTKRYGLVEKQTVDVPQTVAGFQRISDCYLCRKPIESLSQFVRCQQIALCSTAHFHMTCLAEKILREASEFEDALFPIEGRCPRCFSSWQWGQLITDQRALIAISTVAKDNLKIAHSERLIPRSGKSTS